MQPENPLYPKSNELDKLASEALKEQERRELERIIIRQINELFEDDGAIHDTLSEGDDTFGNLLKLRNIRSSGEILNNEPKLNAFFQSNAMPGFSYLMYFKPTVSYLAPHERVDDSSRGVKFSSSVIRLQYSLPVQDEKVFQDRVLSEAPVSVYGIRVGARAKYEGMPDVNMPDVKFDPDELRALVIVGQTGKTCVVVRDESDTAPKHRSANNVESELVFDELQLAIDNLGKEEPA